MPRPQVCGRGINYIKNKLTRQYAATNWVFLLLQGAIFYGDDMKKNDVITSTASGYGTEGAAVFVFGCTPVFVPFCIGGGRAARNIFS